MDVLGYLSLRHWEASADLLFREQARDMAVMAAEKIEMAVQKDEEGWLSGLQRLVLDPDFRPERVAAWKAETALVDRVYLVQRDRRLLYPADATAEESGVAAAVLAEIPPGFWDRGGRRHFVVGGHVVLAAVLPGGARGPVLAVVARNEDVLARDLLPRMLGGIEGTSAVAVLDRAGRAVYASQPLDGARRILTVNFGEALPAWQVALYQPGGRSPKAVVRRQTMLFTAAFALLLVVIVLGLGATYRLVRRESEMARLKSDFVANVSHDLKTPLSLIRMFAETLELGRVTDEATRREYYGVITRESERLTRLIDNVLDFSRIEGTPHQLSRSFSDRDSWPNRCRARSIGGRRAECKAVRIVERPGPQHRNENSHQSIRHAAQGATMRMAAAARCGIHDSAPLIMLDADTCPVVDRLPQAPVARVAHHDLFTFAALVSHGRDAAMATEAVIVTLRQELGRFGEHDAGDTNADPDQGSENLNVWMHGALSRGRLASFETSQQGFDVLFTTRALRADEPEAWKEQRDMRAGGLDRARRNRQWRGPQRGQNGLSVEPSDAVCTQDLLDPSTGHAQHVSWSRNRLKQCP